MALKRPCRACKSTARGTGWVVETFQESDEDDELDRQAQQRPRDLHPHAIATATSTSTRSSIFNAFTPPQSALPPILAQSSFNFMDTTPSNDFQAADENVGFAMDIDTMFEEYNLMDPELSAAWDDNHGLRAKQTRTVSVSCSTPF
jgi:hypothetical protein